MGKKEVEEEVGGIGRVNSKHIRKRALKNKALAISFNDKDLRDFVGGFHKRKKKRRKEAQQKIREKDRLKRIEKRKQRKQERAFVEGGGAPPANGSGPDESSGNLEQDEETKSNEPVSATKTYDAGNLTIMVTTSEISREEDGKEKTNIIPRLSGETEKKHNIPIIKKQQFKTTSKHRSGPRPQKKRDKKKGKKRKT